MNKQNAFPTPRPVQCRKTVAVRVDELIFAQYNPIARTKDGKALRALSANLFEFGQMYPVLITPKRQVIDGHRRVAAMRLHGATEVECLLWHGDPEVAFANVNQAKTITPKDWYEILSHGCVAKREWTQHFASAVSRYGRGEVMAMIAAGKGPATVDFADMLVKLGVRFDRAQVFGALVRHKPSNALNFVVRNKTLDASERVRACEAILTPLIEGV